MHRHSLLLDLPRNKINVLRLDDRLDVVFQNLGEEILQLGSSEMLQNLGPFGRIVVSSQVGLELSCQDLQCRRLSDTVGSYQTQDLTRSRSGKTMQLERVGGITMGDLRVQVGRQVENLDSVKRTPNCD